MFIPNNICQYYKQSGFSARGSRSFEDPTNLECGVVRLQPLARKTSVRADTSATRGAAEEIVTDATLLIPSTLRPDTGDVLKVAGYWLEIKVVEPRFAVDGKLDHYQLECDTKESLA